MLKLVEFDDVISTKPTKGTIQNWSHWFKWNERAEKWDAEQRREAERKAKELRQQELMESLAKFRAVGDRASINSMLTTAESLEGVRKIAQQVIQRLELEAVTNLRDLESIAKTLDILTRNGDKSLDFKAKIEGMDAVLEAMENG